LSWRPVRSGVHPPPRSPMRTDVFWSLTNSPQFAGVSAEFWTLAPEGVSVHVSRVLLLDTRKFADPPHPDDATELLAALPMQAIVFAFTTSYILGPDGGQALKVPQIRSQSGERRNPKTRTSCKAIRECGRVASENSIPGQRQILDGVRERLGDTNAGTGSRQGRTDPDARHGALRTTGAWSGERRACRSPRLQPGTPGSHPPFWSQA
jgi:hypothetical protein